jgi:hypothetical protein
MVALASALQTKAFIESSAQEKTHPASGDGPGFDYKARQDVLFGSSPLIAPAAPVEKEPSGNSINDTSGHKNPIKLLIPDHSS